MRVPPIDRESCSPAVREALDGGPKMKLFDLVAHCEGVFDPWRGYLGALHQSLDLDPRLRELAILQVAHDERCDYERVQHETIGRRVGLSEEQIRAIGDGVEPAELTEPAYPALRVAHEILSDGEASEQAVADLVAAVGVRQAVEFVLVVGQYISLARLMKTFALEPDAPVVSATE